MSIPGAIGLAEELGVLGVTGGAVMPGIGAIVGAANAGGVVAATSVTAHASARRSIGKTNVPSLGFAYYSV